jgi:hypothetical protein
VGDDISPARAYGPYHFIYRFDRWENIPGQDFINQVRGKLKPGTSALFMVIEKVTPDKAIVALSKFGGTVITSSLSKETEGLCINKRCL